MLSLRKKFVTDFSIFPTTGEKRLPVGIAMRQNHRFYRLVCDFGDGSQHKVNQLVMSHVYQKIGTINGSIQVYENRIDKEPQQKIKFKVKVTKPSKIKFISKVGLKSENAIAYLNKKTPFKVSIPNLTTSAIKDITWRFGDGKDESSYKTRGIDHVYKKAGNYNVTVKVTAVDKRTDSKTCKIMVLPKNFHLKPHS